QAKRAFRFMQRAKQIGKVVIIVPNENLSCPICFHAEGTYLITGGLGGLGLAVADWMVAQGARSLALIGRDTPGEEVQKKLENLRTQGAQVLTFVADVADRTALVNVLKTIDNAELPLCGVIHAAGVIVKDVLLNQSWDKYEAVFRTKVYGTWN